MEGHWFYRGLNCFDFASVSTLSRILGVISGNISIDRLSIDGQFMSLVLSGHKPISSRVDILFDKVFARLVLW